MLVLNQQKTAHTTRRLLKKSNKAGKSFKLEKAERFRLMRYGSSYVFFVKNFTTRLPTYSIKQSDTATRPVRATNLFTLKFPLLNKLLDNSFPVLLKC